MTTGKTGFVKIPADVCPPVQENSQASFRKKKIKMISVSEAKALVIQHVSRLAPRTIPLEKANGLVLAEDLHATQDIPAYPQSSMDGYAYAHDGLLRHGSLDVSVVVAAGSEDKPRLLPHQAARIFTGAPVPEGADTIVMQEKCTIKDGKLHLTHPLPVKGENLRPMGSEIRKGNIALESGDRITPAGIGLIAGIGVAEVFAYPLPLVGIIVTGNELQAPGNPLRHGQVYESNSATLKAVLRQVGIDEVSFFRSHDDPVALTTLLEKVLDSHDMVLLTGGISVGDFDHVLHATEACGVKKIFHRIRQKPGKPLYFGMLGNKPVFGLPGNPASVLTCFYEYVALALARICERDSPVMVCQMPVAAGFRKPAGSTHFLKGRHHNGTVTIMDAQESYRLRSFARANGLVVLDEGTTELSAGDLVEVHVFPT